MRDVHAFILWMVSSFLPHRNGGGEIENARAGDNVEHHQLHGVCALRGLYACTTICVSSLEQRGGEVEDKILVVFICSFAAAETQPVSIYPRQASCVNEAGVSTLDLVW